MWILLIRDPESILNDNADQYLTIATSILFWLRWDGISIFVPSYLKTVILNYVELLRPGVAFNWSYTVRSTTSFALLKINFQDKIWQIPHWPLKCLLLTVGIITKLTLFYSAQNSFLAIVFETDILEHMFCRNRNPFETAGVPAFCGVHGQYRE